jgi:hypothetical protein
MGGTGANRGFVDKLGVVCEEEGWPVTVGVAVTNDRRPVWNSCCSCLRNATIETDGERPRRCIVEANSLAMRYICQAEV